MNRIKLTLRAVVASLLLAACSGGGGGGDGAPDAGTVSIGGTITAAANIAVDNDTNDPDAASSSNNTLATAQAIANPVMVGGFVTALPTGIAGSRFATTADVDDVYAVDLAAGQSVSLEMAEPAPADIDLGLYDASGALVDASVGLSRFESVTATAAGRYFLRVNAFSGRSNYVLSVGTGALPASTLSLASEFVANEAIVHFGLGAGQSVADKSVADIAGPGLTAKAGKPDRPMLMALSGGIQALAAAGAAPPMPLSGTHMTAAQAAKLDTLYQVKALRRRADVQTADLNYVIKPSKTPNDPLYSLQWHYPLINLPQAWDVTTGTPASGEVVVAVVDTGVFLGHEDLANALLRDGGGNVVGYDFIRSTAASNDGDGIDANADDPGDESTPASSSWHGTHVAGTIAARSDNGVGVAGVSWGARIMPVRVLGQGGATSYDVMQGIRYAAGLANDSGTLPSRRADIINLSLGCANCFSSTEQALFTQVRNAGVIVIAAAGNENSGQPGYPASYDGVVSVSAVDINRGRAPYSNFGPNIDVAAPGGDASLDRNGDGHGDGVLSTLVGANRTSDYRFYQGTSMAAPHVCGVVALMKAVYPALSPNDLDALLASGAITTDLGPAGRDDEFGWGLIDAAKAVLAAQRLAAGATAATLVANPNRFDFGVSLTTATLDLAKLGDGALSVTTVTSDATWLTVAPGSVNADGLGSYTVSVNRAGLPAGSYSATLTVAASSGLQVKLPVSMQVLTGPVQVNTGHYWVLLLDKDFNLVSQQAQVGSNGRYTFQFSNLAKGTYFLYAGTDSDWDDLVCDEGEACGAYPTLGQPVAIELNGNVGNLDFVVGFNSSPSTLSTTAIPAAAGLRHGVRAPGKGIGHGE